MRVIITGDRGWDCDELARRVVRRLVARYSRKSLTIIHGSASGVDMSFQFAATVCGVAREQYPADWATHGKSAGPKRNAAMVSKGAGLCIAVHRFLMNSKGTKDCVRQALAAGIPTWLIDSDDGEPARLAPDDPRLK
jgi:hypothetical protein